MVPFRFFFIFQFSPYSCHYINMATHSHTYRICACHFLFPLFLFTPMGNFERVELEVIWERKKKKNQQNDKEKERKKKYLYTVCQTNGWNRHTGGFYVCNHTFLPAQQLFIWTRSSQRQRECGNRQDKDDVALRKNEKIDGGFLLYLVELSLFSMREISLFADQSGFLDYSSSFVPRRSLFLSLSLCVVL